jgi:nitrile hydratase
VVDSTADYRWMVLPLRPAGTEGWDEDALAALVTRDVLVGVVLPQAPPQSPPRSQPEPGVAAAA